MQKGFRLFLVPSLYDHALTLIGNVDEISLSESTARRSRATARATGAKKVKENFLCSNGQINFDGILLTDFWGFGKVNRLAVLIVQEAENQLLCITKTEDSTGKTEAVEVGKALEAWGIKKVCCLTSLPVEERTLLTKKIRSLPPANLKVCKPHLPQATVDSCLLDFVGPRSVLLFNLLWTSHTFLLEDDWMEQPDYFTTAVALKNLSPLNESCERALALATIVNGKMTRTESSFQELVLVVEKHRKMYKMKTKKDMNKLF